MGQLRNNKNYRLTSTVNVTPHKVKAQTGMPKDWTSDEI